MIIRMDPIPYCHATVTHRRQQERSRQRITGLAAVASSSSYRPSNATTATNTTIPRHPDTAASCYAAAPKKKQNQPLQQPLQQNASPRPSLEAQLEQARQLLNEFLQPASSSSSENNNNNNNNSTTRASLTQAYCDELLAHCIAHDEWDAVLDVLDVMKQAGLRQVHSTYTASLQACFQASNAATAQELLHAMTQAGVTPDPTDIGWVVLTLCRSNNNNYHHHHHHGKEKASSSTLAGWRPALALVKQHDNLPIEAYDAVLSCMIAEPSHWKEAVGLLRLLEQASLGTDDETNESRSATKPKQTQKTDHKATSTTPTRPAISTYRIVIECCVQAQQAEQAVQVLRACVQRAKLIPTAYAFELVVTALTRKLQWRRAVQVLEWMDDWNVPKTLVVYNAILTACAKAREVVPAKNLLVQMEKRDGIAPDIISYNAVVSACASHARHWSDALRVLDQCHRAPGVTPDIYTYTNAIRACAKGTYVCVRARLESLVVTNNTCQPEKIVFPETSVSVSSLTEASILSVPFFFSAGCRWPNPSRTLVAAGGQGQASADRYLLLYRRH